MNPVDLELRLLTVDDYHAMGRAGILGEDDRVELIDGRIVLMSPIGAPHILCVMWLNHQLTERIHAQQHAGLFVSVQNPLRLDAYNEPEPDVVLLRLPPGFREAPRAEHALLVVEVADTTLATDRAIKQPRYAAAGIPESWIVNLPETRLEIYRRPDASGYAETHVLAPGDAAEIPALGQLPVAALFDEG